MSFQDARGAGEGGGVAESLVYLGNELVTKRGSLPMQYKDIQWNRKSWFNSLLALFGVLGLYPLLWWSCINVITGEVYYSDYDEYGNLRKWSKANEIVAFILLTLNILWILYIVVPFVATLIFGR